MRKKKKTLIIGIILLVLALGIGYAYLNTTLNISGTTDVDSNTWNVYWDNVQVTTGSVTAATPTIDTSKTTVSFSAHLSKPGDFYEFTVDAINDGSIDAMIDTITNKLNGTEISTTNPLPAYVNYIVTYEDDIAIANHHILMANSIETYKVRVEYKTDINPSDLPATAQSLNLSFGVNYVQGDSNATPVRTTIYNISETSFTIGSNAPTGVTTYSNYQDAITAFGHPFFLKHTIVNNTITRSYVGFVLNDTVYYIRGGVDEVDLSVQPIYEANKSVLQSIFGIENCEERIQFYNEYRCSDLNSHVNARVTATGFAVIHDEDYECIIRNNTYFTSSCESYGV